MWKNYRLLEFNNLIVYEEHLIFQAFNIFYSKIIMNSFSSQYSGPGLSFVTYGNTYILFYNGKVLITIGPHCII